MMSTVKLVAPVTRFFKWTRPPRSLKPGPWTCRFAGPVQSVSCPSWEHFTHSRNSKVNDDVDSTDSLLTEH